MNEPEANLTTEEIPLDPDEFNIEPGDAVFILAIILVFVLIVAVVCRFTVSMATPINTANSTPVIEHRDLENQVNWADRELLYLQRGPLMANDSSNYRF
eukprot:00678.XXX_421_1482_1 [CDS] Oithona nana genome sequencing.